MFDEIENFVIGIFSSLDHVPTGWMTVTQAEKELEEMRSMPWCYDVPEGTTPELYAYFFNEQLEKDLQPHAMRFSDEELAILHRGVRMLGAALEGWEADGAALPYSSEAVDALIDRISKERERR